MTQRRKKSPVCFYRSIVPDKNGWMYLRPHNVSQDSSSSSSSSSSPSSSSSSSSSSSLFCYKLPLLFNTRLTESSWVHVRVQSRQEGPHPHMACFDRENQHLLVHLSCKLAIGIWGVGGDVSYVFPLNNMVGNVV